jgi:hypothetical protein
MAAGTQTFNSLPIGVFLESLQEVFTNRVKSIPDLIPRLFAVKHTDRFRSTYQSFAGLPEFQTWDMESAISVESFDPRYETTITQAGWRKAVAYTYKTKTYVKYDLMKDLADALGLAAATTKQRYAFSFINAQLAGTGTKWNTAEGKYLFANDHPLSPGATAATGSNLVTGALSHAKLAEAIRLLYLTPDDMGTPMHLLPRYLWVHPDQEETAYVVLQSRAKSGTPNNDANFLKDKYGGIEIIACPWFTDTDAWLLQSDQHKLICEVSIPLEARMYEEDSTRNTVHDACFAFAVGAKDWRGVVGSTGA